MPDNDSFQGRTVLVVQPTLGNRRRPGYCVEAKGVHAVPAKNSHFDLANIPNLAAAVLGSHSRDLAGSFKARAIPFVLYAALIDHECTAAAIIQNPAPPPEVIARVEELLT